jgi:hypothetical protein
MKPTRVATWWGLDSLAVNKLITVAMVPVLYAICVGCLILSNVEDLRRSWLAADISELVRVNSPEDLAALTAILQEKVDSVHLKPAREEEGIPKHAAIVLEPSVWLSLWATLEGEDDRLIDLVFFCKSSDEIPIDSPEQIPPPPWYTWFILIALFLIPSGLWVFGRLSGGCLGQFLAAIPIALLVLLLPMAVIALMRMQF